MPTTMIETLDQRLLRIERAVRKLRNFSGILAAMLLAILVVGARQNRSDARDEVRAHRLVIVDEAGVEHVRISGATIYINGGKFGRLEASVGSFGPTFSMFTSDPKPRIQMSTFPNGSSALYFFTSGTLNQTRTEVVPDIVLSAEKDGPNLQLNDRDGFSTTLGFAKTERQSIGEKTQTSAASVILSHYDKILRSAP